MMVHYHLMCFNGVSPFTPTSQNLSVWDLACTWRAYGSSGRIFKGCHVFSLLLGLSIDPLERPNSKGNRCPICGDMSSIKGNRCRICRSSAAIGCFCSMFPPKFIVVNSLTKLERCWCRVLSNAVTPYRLSTFSNCDFRPRLRKAIAVTY